MGIQDELVRMGYTFEYERGDSEERAEVWVNKAAGMAVRIEWFRLDETGNHERRQGKAGRHPNPG